MDRKIQISMPFGSATLTYIRADLPVKFLKKELKKRNIVLEQAGILDPNANVSAFQFANILPAPTVEGLQKLQKVSLLNHTIDDNYWQIEQDNPAIDLVTKLQKTCLSLCIESADSVWVTTEPLKKLLKDKATIVPNLISADDYDPIKDKKPVCFWSGSASHFGDLDELKNLCKDMREMEFRFFGICPRANTDYFVNGRTFNTMPLGDNVFFIPGTPLCNYFSALNYYKGTIGLAPIANNKFNCCKSCLKLWEYSMLGMTIVASDAYPYNQTIKDGVNGYLAINNDWKSAIEKAIDSPICAREEFIENNTWQSQKCRNQWADAYEKIVEFPRKEMIKGLAYA